MYELKVNGTDQVMLEAITDSRDEIQGTSIDEEGINMMNFQKWYNAVARMTTTLDEALDKLINGTGRVGL
jgi:flagellar hook-associated protein 1 FlgK